MVKGWPEIYYGFSQFDAGVTATAMIVGLAPLPDEIVTSRDALLPWMVLSRMAAITGIAAAR